MIFADLNLVPAQGPTGNFSVIGTLLEEKIKPSGPYFIVLWTRYPKEAAELHEFLDRLDKVTKPLAVQALDKADYLDPTGKVKNPETLAKAIGGMIAGQPQVAALFDWETRISDAAANTVLSILELVEAAVADADRAEEIGRLLASLAVGAVGKEHVEEDRFRAVNDALLPILADRIASMRSREDDKSLWRDAFDNPSTRRNLSPDEAAKLNRLLHIATPPTDAIKPGERGAVIPLLGEFSGDAFESKFNLTQEMAASTQFGCQKFEENNEMFRWILVQTQAACDYAQTRPGPLSFHLGLYLPAARDRKGKQPPAALWTSPCFELDGKARLLHVNARFQVSLPTAKVEGTHPLFRLREQLLSDMIYRIHSYGARPGFISFR